MKGWLKTASGIIPLSTIQPTSVGRDCCDVIIPCSVVESNHCIIQYDVISDCFVLRDLNSCIGTNVNGVHVRNTSVCLAPGDIIKIGDAVQFEYGADRYCKCNCKYMCDGQVGISSTKTCGDYSFPKLVNPNSSLSVSPTDSIASLCHNGNANSPRTQTHPFGSGLAAKPSSIGGSVSRLNDFNETGQGVGECCPCKTSGITVEEMKGKDKKILELNEELCRLQLFELKSQHKDIQIKELSGQVECLQTQLRQVVKNRSNRVEVEALQTRATDLDKQLKLKNSEVESLNEKISKMRTDSQKEVTEKVSENGSLRETIDKLRKDKNILSGLLSTVQRDVTAKDSTILHLTSDVARLKKDLLDKDAQIASFQSAFCIVDSHKTYEIDLEQAQKDMTEKLKNLEANNEQIKQLSDTLNRVKQELHHEKQKQKVYHKQSVELVSKLDETEKSRQCLNQELTKVTSMSSRFRHRIHRLLSLRLLAKAPQSALEDEEEDVTDDQIICVLKQMIEEGNSISEVRKKLEYAEAVLQSIKECGEKLSQELKASTGETKLNVSESLLALRLEHSTIQVMMMQPNLQDFQRIMLSMIQVQLNQQNEIKTTLESLGYNVKLSNQGTGERLVELHSKCEDYCRKYNEAKDKLEDSNRQFRRDLEEARDRGRQEVEQRSRELMETLKRESEMSLLRQEKEKISLDEKLSEELSKVSKLEERLFYMEQQSTEKLAELNYYKEQEKQHQQEIESYQKIEAELRKEILDRNQSKAETRASMEQSIRKKCDQEIVCMKEQMASMSATLSAIQERLSKANNKIHKQQAEIATLKSSSSCSVNNSSHIMAGSDYDRPKASFEALQLNEKLRTDIKKHQSEIKKLNLEVGHLRKVIGEKDGTISNQQTELQEAKAMTDRALSEGNSNLELAATGAECVGEKHLLTITRQKETISELRKRMKALEGAGTPGSGKYPAPTGQTDEGLASPPKESSLPSDQVEQQIQKALQDGSAHSMKAPSETLLMTEQAYSSLLETVTDTLSMHKVVNKIPALTSSTHVDAQLLGQHRQSVCLEIRAELLDVIEKVTAYENKIKIYEREMTRMRNADALLERKSWQVDSLTSDVRSLVDEVSCLHQTLTKVRADLQTEKQLNRENKKSAECDRSRKIGSIVKHTCSHHDKNTKVKERIPTTNSELLRKKDCEIMMLKRELRRSRDFEKSLNLTTEDDQQVGCASCHSCLEKNSWEDNNGLM